MSEAPAPSSANDPVKQPDDSWEIWGHTFPRKMVYLMVVTVVLMVLAVADYLFVGQWIRDLIEMQVELPISRSQVSEEEVSEPRATTEPISEVDELPLEYYVSLKDNKWVTYENDDFSIRLPSGIQILDNENSVSFMKAGPSWVRIRDRGDYDGIALYFGVNPKEGRSLLHITEEEVKAMEEAGATISSIEPISVAGISGYKFEMEYEGSSRVWYLSKNENSENYLRVLDISEDPTDEGFEMVVGQMLGSLELKD